jgi:adenylyl-sulfate kinase
MWLTGLPCSGKSTLASLLQRELCKRHLPSVVLDGDMLRSGLNKDLDFSMEGRKENIRRAVEVCKLIMGGGIIPIAALISPLEKEREWARQYLGEEKFTLVFLDCSLEVCEQRDVKGMYRKVRKGIIKNFTGIDSPFEIPQNPDLILNTSCMSSTDCVYSIWTLIQERHFQAEVNLTH